MLRQVRELKLRWLAVGLLLLAAACKREAPAEDVDGPAKKPPEAKAGAGAANAEADEYTVAIGPKGELTAGQAGAVAVTIATRKGFHINPEYPMAFKPEGHAGVTFAEERLKLTAGSTTPCAEKAEDACGMEVPIALTAGTAGAATVAGKLAFSVCNPERCLIEKVALSLPVTVSPSGALRK